MSTALADKIERASMITPDGERFIRQAVHAIRRQGPQRDEKLEARQRTAVGRIEAVLQSTVGALPTIQARPRRDFDPLQFDRVNN